MDYCSPFPSSHSLSGMGDDVHLRRVRCRERSLWLGQITMEDSSFQRASYVEQGFMPMWAVRGQPSGSLLGNIKMILCLNLGCGTLNRTKEEVGYDIDPSCKPDVLGNAENLPFKDSSFDEVRAVHVLEHIQNIVKVANEVSRVLRAGGRFHIIVPLFPSVGSIADPTHVRYFVPETFPYFVREKALPGLKHTFEMGELKTNAAEIYCVLRKT